MLQKISEKLQAPLQQESLARRGERMLPAAMYGALVALAYTLGFALVNVYSFPKLPLGFEWGRFFGMGLGFGLALALAGAIAGWFSEEYSGIVAGGALITALMAVAFLVQMGAGNSMLTMQSVLMAVPLFGVDMLIVGALRWTARRHLEIVQKEAAEIRPKRLARHILLIVVVGLFIGILGRMDSTAEKTLTQLHAYLQAAPTDSSAWVHLPLRQVPALKQHVGVDYVFYVHQSGAALGTLDLKVRFADGFVMSCLLPVGDASFFTGCREGE